MPAILKRFCHVRMYLDWKSDLRATIATLTQVPKYVPKHGTRFLEESCWVNTE